MLALASEPRQRALQRFKFIALNFINLPGAITMTSRNEVSALHAAVMRGSVVEVQEAINLGEDIDTLDWAGRTPLFGAVIDGNCAIVSELISHGANVNTHDKNLQTPLHFAAQEYRVEIAQLLLKHGAQVDARDSHGNTPLAKAVFGSRGRGEMITVLLAHAADKNLKNKHGTSPSDLAASIGNYDVKQFLE